MTNNQQNFGRLKIDSGDETKTQSIAAAVAATDQTAGDEPGYVLGW